MPPIPTWYRGRDPVTTFLETFVLTGGTERACERRFDAWPLVEAVLAAAALPGIVPPVEIDGEHFIDGGIVNSIPVCRAVELGATRIFVLHADRLDRPLEPPRRPSEVGLGAFEIARRHRFIGDLARRLVAHARRLGRRAPPAKRPG